MDEVQEILDEMVPALKDLQERSIFTPQEIHQIVDRRRNSEYDLRRRQDARKADFLRYIQAEMNLEMLRQLRTKKLNREKQNDSQTAQDDNSSQNIGDSHIAKLIHTLWMRTITKFGKSDVSLYLQYADYCKEVKAHKALSRILAQALQLFPHNDGLWAEAASHEFFVLGSIQNARVLMQQGLRQLPKSQDLWIQLFCLELHFVERMNVRKQILQGGDSEMVPTVRDDNDGASMEKHHQIAKLVYNNAIASIPKDVAFRLKFWDQCRLFSSTENLQRFIVSSIRQDLCKDNPDAWMAWALYQWEQRQQQEQQAEGGDDFDENQAEPSPKKQKLETKTDSKQENENWTVLDVLRQATKSLQTEDMYLKAIRMILRYIASLQEQEGDDSDNEDEEEDADIAAGLELIETLFKEAEGADFYSSELVMEYALFLQRLQRKEESAGCLERFANSKPLKESLKVWVNLAEVSDSVSVLNKALSKADMGEKNYFELLLHVFGAKIQAKDDSELMDLFDKLVLLTPGLVPLLEIEEPIFGVTHALDACMQLLQFLNDSSTMDTTAARKVYRTVIFESSLGTIFTSFDGESMADFIEEAVKTEDGETDSKKKRTNTIRLYEESAKLFGNSEISRIFQEKARELKLAGSATKVPSFVVSYGSPKVDDEFTNCYDKYKVVLLKQRIPLNQKQSFRWESLAELFTRVNREDQSTWCVETPGRRETDMSPEAFLTKGASDLRGYCSFLVQNDTKAYTESLSSLPIQDPLPSLSWQYASKALWFFFGRNPKGSLNLRGRPEHTDSITTDGTWHCQLSGSKTWFIRPTPQLMEHLMDHKVDISFDTSARVRVDCEEGDVLCINTRLWFHSTIILPQDVPSVSYARDFYKDASTVAIDSTASAKRDGGTMKNLDGLYATNDIEEGTLIFSENEMPDCELHRSSTNPNCEVVELEDGTSALVSTKPIAAGDFFCVAESEDEMDEDEMDEEEE